MMGEDRGNPMPRGLNAEKIVETAARLQQRINERFPGSGLGQVAAQLHDIALESVIRSAEIRKPQVLLRITIGMLVCGIVVVLVLFIPQLKRTNEFMDLVNFAQF